MEDPHLWVFG